MPEEDQVGQDKRLILCLAHLLFEKRLDIKSIRCMKKKGKRDKEKERTKEKERRNLVIYFAICK
jgi:hypothetical protein